jgi:tRNA(adenine34) deaminase
MGKRTREEDRRLMERALREARRAERAGEVPIGAVAACGGEVVAVGHNRTLTSTDPTAHAEVVLLRRAARKLGSHRLTELDIYVTVEPCLMCLGALVQARIARLIFAAADPKVGALRLLRLKSVGQGLNHRFPVVRGVLADESAALLRAFFAERRRP